MLFQTSKPIHCFTNSTTVDALKAAALSRDLDIITSWKAGNLLDFNASKKQNIEPRIFFQGVNIFNDLLIRACKYIPFANLATLYKAQIQLGLEYSSHFWDSVAPTTLSLPEEI